ncbi:MAG: carbohydrate ABC transporter permease [Oscillospiraceae bacterium]|nr:carbohydrate ABC transporter permease [Oscillospiraceae bacterium]
MSKKVTYAGEGSTSFQTKVLVKSTLIYIALILLTLICLVPIWILIVNSTRQHNDIISGVSLIPGTNFFQNLNTLKTNSLYNTFYHPLVGMRNSLIIAGSCCALTVFFSGLTAYGLVVYDFKAKGPMFTFILAVMMVPSQVTAVGFMKMLVSLGLLDNYIPLIVPSIAAPAIVFFMRQYMLSSFPLDIIEAARIDGSSEFRTFLTISIPMMKPAFAVQAIFAFIGKWNDYYNQSLVLVSTKPNQITMPMMVQKVLSIDRNADYGANYTAITLSIIPVVVIYVVLSKFIIGGVAAGGVKE